MEFATEFSHGLDALPESRVNSRSTGFLPCTCHPLNRKWSQTVEAAFGVRVRRDFRNRHWETPGVQSEAGLNTAKARGSLSVSRFYATICRCLEKIRLWPVNGLLSVRPQAD